MLLNRFKKHCTLLFFYPSVWHPLLQAVTSATRQTNSPVASTQLKQYSSAKYYFFSFNDRGAFARLMAALIGLLLQQIAQRQLLGEVAPR